MNMTGIKCILSAYLLAYFLVFKSIFECIFHSFLGHELLGPTYYSIMYRQLLHSINGLLAVGKVGNILCERPSYKKCLRRRKLTNLETK